MRLTTLAIALVGSLALITAPTTSHASSTPEPTPLAPVTQDLSPTEELLWSLAGTQDEEEIASIIDSGVPRAELFDPIADEVVSVVEVVTPPFSSRAITISGPGCSLKTACIKQNGVPNGYNGTGKKTGPWKNASYVASGERLTTFWVSATVGYALTPNMERTFTTPVTIESFTRS